MPQNKKPSPLGNGERNALLLGLAAIVLVFLFSIVRFLGTSGKKDSLTKNTTEESNEEAVIQYPTISFENLQNKLRSGEKITLLDIRSFDEFMLEHAVGAVNVPTEQLNTSDKIDGNNVFIIIGKSDDDQELATAVTALKNKNFSPLVLAGGMYNWKVNGGQTISFGNPSSFLDQSKVNYLEIENAKDALEKNSSILILDVRDNSEFESGHIKNAKNIPLLDIEKRRNELSGYQYIFVFGLNEVQAFQAAVQVYDLTLMRPFVIKGSMPKWQQLGYELVK